MSFMLVKVLLAFLAKENFLHKIAWYVYKVYK